MKFKIHDVNSAPEASKQILEAAKGKSGFVPNLYGVLAENPEALKSYLALGASFSNCGLDPVEQQIVLLSVSRNNGCDYCVSAHSAIAKSVGVENGIVSAIRSGEPLQIPRLQALRHFSEVLCEKRGWAGDAEVSLFKKAGFSDSDILAVVLGVTMKTLSNYTNHICETTLDKAFEDFKWSRKP